ncbi:GMC family oxidoreductase [Aliikangiella marina]|uniref:GMC family oxidoreductase n=1 Tax=Aliikangiella marina TaxID=1712262 RepID=A0A545TEH3_9GAMM|nr:GMC family oxidoreductase [Aliikangiella marina]
MSYPNTTNFSEQTPPQSITVDLVVVGSGAGGGVAAEILSRSGLKVLIVEEGPLRTSADFKMREKEAYADLYQEVASRQTLDKSIQILQGRCVGGSTTVNWTSSFRTPSQTLDYWQSEFNLKGFNREALDPWFAWAEQRLNIAPWEVPPNANNQKLADGLDALGWSHQIIRRNVNGCANLGYCGTGCPINAKQSMLVSCIPEALKNGAQLFSRARVESLIVNGAKIDGLWLSSMDKNGQVKQKRVTKVVAKHIVLSAGAIGSPAILLRSSQIDRRSSLGKRTFLHPVSACIGRMPDKVNAYQGAPQSVYSDEFLWRDGVAGELGYKLEAPPLHPTISAIMLRQHGDKHFELMKDFAHFHASLALIRDGFNSESVGGEVSLDSYGYPQLDYQISDMTWRALKDSLLKLTEIQFAAGAKGVLPIHMDASFYGSWRQAEKAIKALPTVTSRFQVMSAHVMGGCHFGGENSNSVCDSSGRVNGLENLSVMDGSLFPTSLGVNPQLSIYGIVAKLATQLGKELGANPPEDLVRIADMIS